MANKKSSRKQGTKTNAARASHPSRIVRGSLSPAFPPLRGGEPTALVRQRSQVSATFTSTAAAPWFGESWLCNLCGGQQPNPLREREVEEAAMPGQPVRTHARFRISPGNSPSRIASCHRRHRNRRSASVESSNVFAEPTLREKVASRNRKTFARCAEAVDDTTSLWKAEENGVSFERV